MVRASQEASSRRSVLGLVAAGGDTELVDSAWPPVAVPAAVDHSGPAAHTGTASKQATDLSNPVGQQLHLECTPPCLLPIASNAQQQRRECHSAARVHLPAGSSELNGRPCSGALSVVQFLGPSHSTCPRALGKAVASTVNTAAMTDKRDCNVQMITAAMRTAHAAGDVTASEPRLPSLLCFCRCTGIAALAVPQQANALVNPAQESYGGLGRNTGKAGSSPKSPTRASMEGYTLEGTKKQGLSLKQKKKLMARAKKEALEVAAAK